LEKRRFLFARYLHGLMILDYDPPPRAR